MKCFGDERLACNVLGRLSFGDNCFGFGHEGFLRKHLVVFAEKVVALTISEVRNQLLKPKGGGNSIRFFKVANSLE
jgi:hypothetical protein